MSLNLEGTSLLYFSPQVVKVYEEDAIRTPK